MSIKYVGIDFHVDLRLLLRVSFSNKSGKGVSECETTDCRKLTCLISDVPLENKILTLFYASVLTGTYRFFAECSKTGSDLVCNQLGLSYT